LSCQKKIGTTAGAGSMLADSSSLNGDSDIHFHGSSPTRAVHARRQCRSAKPADQIFPVFGGT